MIKARLLLKSGIKWIKPLSVLFLMIITISIYCGDKTYAAPEDGDGVSGVSDIFVPTIPNINISVGDENSTPESRSADSIQMLLLLAVISVSPYLLVMLTSFSRILITLHFLRSALGTQQMPPNQILIGISLFLTFFIMGNTFSEINEKALKPFSEGTITQEVAITEGMKPLRTFMLKFALPKDLDLFAGLSGATGYDSIDEIPNSVIIPAFSLGELKRGFFIGFIIYIPFIVIDMVVASVLMAMGMMMLPPAMISLPFKIMFFILVDGWELIINQLVISFIK